MTDQLKVWLALTPALSPGERETVAARLESSGAALAVAASVRGALDAPTAEPLHSLPPRQKLLPLPGGEGRGEGERYTSPRRPAPTAEPFHSLPPRQKLLPLPGGTAIELSEMVTSGCSRSVRRRRLPAPTGLRPKAQGCRAAATLGILATERPTPTGLRQGKRTRRHNPFGVVHSSTRLPRVVPLRGPTLGWRTQPRWGTIAGCSLIPRPCSPALPRGEGGLVAAVGRNGAVRRLERLERDNAKSGARAFTPRRHDLPLPGGEGRGEGGPLSPLNSHRARTTTAFKNLARLTI